MDSPSGMRKPEERLNVPPIQTPSPRSHLSLFVFSKKSPRVIESVKIKPTLCDEARPLQCRGEEGAVIGSTLSYSHSEVQSIQTESLLWLADEWNSLTWTIYSMYGIFSTLLCIWSLLGMRLSPWWLCSIAKKGTNRQKSSLTFRSEIPKSRLWVHWFRGIWMDEWMSGTNSERHEFTISR